MELKEVIAVFRGEIIRLEEQLKSVDMVYREQRLKVRIEALQTAISHLETLQKVKEAGGMKRRENVFRSGTNYDTAYNAGWNDCLDAVHAELPGKLEGLKDINAKTKGCKPNQEDCAFGKCHDWSGCKIQQQAIQELFLGKKEE